MRKGRGADAAGDSGRQAGGASAHAGAGTGARRGVRRETAGGFAWPGSGGAVAGDLQPRIARADRANQLESETMKNAFFDIDSQLDFLYPAGALYVPGAERIRSEERRVGKEC